MRVLLVLSLFGLIGLSFGTLTPDAEASHQARIVLPYGVDERHVPVLQGFKVVPDPMQCDSGTPSGTTLFSHDFETPGGYSLAHSWTDPLHNTVRNQWHTTDFAGGGTDEDHSTPGRLYFGNDATGVFAVGNLRTSGAAVFDLSIPAEGTTYVAFNTKWSGEWLEGYDHMWVEADVGDGELYIICTVNPEGRGDPTSGMSTAASCSPYRTIPCPSDARGLDPLDMGDRVDPHAPHWEARYVQIPDMFRGQELKLRFTLESSDGVSNHYMGWMIDDLVLTDAVLPGVPMGQQLTP